MTNEVALIKFTDEQVNLIKRTIAPTATSDEFGLMLYQAKTYGLDPLRGQIAFVKYGETARIFATRDGYLEIAHRSGQFDGMESGTKKDDDGNLIGWARVFRKDMAHPFYVEVALSEYDKKKNLWASSPKTMITKVAESQALRKAFRISGLYTSEEFDEQDSRGPVERDPGTGDIIDADATIEESRRLEIEAMHRREELRKKGKVISS